MSEFIARVATPGPQDGGLRARLLESAAEAFRTRGYEAVGLTEIAEGAGATEDDLVGCFPSKRAMALILLAETFVRDVKAGWIDPARRAPELGPAIAAVFRGVAAELAEAHRRNGVPIRHLALELSTADPDFRTIVEALFDAWRDAIETRLVAEGEPEAATLATFAVTAFSGVMALAKANQSVGVILAAADQIEERFAARVQAG